MTTTKRTLDRDRLTAGGVLEPLQWTWRGDDLILINGSQESGRYQLWWINEHQFTQLGSNYDDLELAKCAYRELVNEPAGFTPSADYFARPLRDVYAAAIEVLDCNAGWPTLTTSQHREVSIGEDLYLAIDSIRYYDGENQLRSNFRLFVTTSEESHALSASDNSLEVDEQLERLKEVLIERECDQILACAKTAIRSTAGAPMPFAGTRIDVTPIGGHHQLIQLDHEEPQWPDECEEPDDYDGHYYSLWLTDLAESGASLLCLHTDWNWYNVEDDPGRLLAEFNFATGRTR